MAHIRQRSTKAGKKYYEIIVSRGRNKSALSMSWHPPEKWCQKSIDRELAKVSADFERRVKAGLVISRAETRDKELREASEAAKIYTLKRFGEEVFMPAKSITMSENSRSNYQGYLVNTIYPELGNKKVTEITALDISSFLLQMQASGKTHSTALKIYTILQGLFKMAYHLDMLEKNPMDKVLRPRPRKSEMRLSEPKAYTGQEIRRLLQAIDNEPLQWRLYIRLLIDTGMRRGECCGLRWEDINLSTRAINTNF